MQGGLRFFADLQGAISGRAGSKTVPALSVGFAIPTLLVPMAHWAVNLLRRKHWRSTLKRSGLRMTRHIVL